MRQNVDAQWILVHFGGNESDLSNLFFPGLMWPPNLQVVHTTPEDVQQFVETALSFSFPAPLRTMPHGSKLNDWKAAFGKIFHTIISGCEFWGYGDLDVIYGNLRYAVPAAVRTRSDIITWKKGKQYMSGPCTFFKNTDVVNNLFFQEKDWRLIISDWAGNGAFDVPGLRMYDEQGMQQQVSTAEKAGQLRVSRGEMGYVCSTDVSLVNDEVCHWFPSNGSLIVHSPSWRTDVCDYQPEAAMIHFGYSTRHTEQSLTRTYIKNLLHNGFHYRRFDAGIALASGMRSKREHWGNQRGNILRTFTHLMVNGKCPNRIPAPLGADFSCREKANGTCPAHADCYLP